MSCNSSQQKVISPDSEKKKKKDFIEGERIVDADVLCMKVKAQTVSLLANPTV